MCRHQLRVHVSVCAPGNSCACAPPRMPSSRACACSNISPLLQMYRYIPLYAAEECVMHTTHWTRRSSAQRASRRAHDRDVSLLSVSRRNGTARTLSLHSAQVSTSAGWSAGDGSAAAAARRRPRTWFSASISCLRALPDAPTARIEWARARLTTRPPTEQPAPRGLEWSAVVRWFQMKFGANDHSEASCSRSAPAPCTRAFSTAFSTASLSCPFARRRTQKGSCLTCALTRPAQDLVWADNTPGRGESGLEGASEQPASECVCVECVTGVAAVASDVVRHTRTHAHTHTLSHLSLSNTHTLQPWHLTARPTSSTTRR
jgi:hypothetical protein